MVTAVCTCGPSEDLLCGPAEAEMLTTYLTLGGVIVWFPAIYYNVSDSMTHSCAVLESHSKCSAAGGPECAHEANWNPCNEGASIWYNFEPMTSESH